MHRIRPCLLVIFLLDMLLFFSLLNPARLTLVHSVQDTLQTLFCGGYFLATLMTLAALILWSPQMQARFSSRLIRGTRVWAQMFSLILMSGLFMLSLISFLFLHTAVLGVGLIGLLALIEFLCLYDRDLTPAREEFSHRITR